MAPLESSTAECYVGVPFQGERNREATYLRSMQPENTRAAELKSRRLVNDWSIFAISWRAMAGDDGSGSCATARTCAVVQRLILGMEIVRGGGLQQYKRSERGRSSEQFAPSTTIRNMADATQSVRVSRDHRTVGVIRTAWDPAPGLDVRAGKVRKNVLGVDSTEEREVRVHLTQRVAGRKLQMKHRMSPNRIAPHRLKTTSK